MAGYPGDVEHASTAASVRLGISLPGIRCRQQPVSCEFFHQLAVELGVQLTAGMLPRAVAGTIVDGMKSKPTLLFLDGLEVMLSRECTLPGGITDAALAELLRRLADPAETHGSCFIATSRRSLREPNEPGVARVEVEYLRINSLHKPAGAQNDQGALRKAAALLMGSISSESNEVLRAGVRSILEELADRPARSLLLAVSLFQHAPDFETLLNLLKADPPIPWGERMERGSC